MMRVPLLRSCNVQPLKGVVALCTMRTVQRARDHAAIVQSCFAPSKSNFPAISNPGSLLEFLQRQALPLAEAIEANLSFRE